MKQIRNIQLGGVLFLKKYKLLAGLEYDGQSLMKSQEKISRLAVVMNAIFERNKGFINGNSLGEVVLIAVDDMKLFN